jgi:four helix bundle protein
LEDRTLEFSKRVIRLCKELQKDVINIELIKQIIRSATSIGANYREANECLGKKDFLHRLRISRKEAKETTYWLELIIEANPEKKKEAELLLQETIELRNILSSIITKSE